MFKYLSIMIVLSVLTTSASAEIYLRKDSHGAAKPTITAKPSAHAGSVANDSAHDASSKEIAPNEEPPKDVVPSRNALSHARNVAKSCLKGQWEAQPCLKAVSENNLVMASNYAAALSENAKPQSAENIKQHCAASTAASRDTYPAAAMRSAFVECVNAIVTEAREAGITPDQSQFQLLVSAVQCLDGTPSCAVIEQGLSAYK